MKLIQSTLALGVSYFIIRLILDKSEEAKTCCFMSIMVLLIVFLLLYQVESINKQLKNEIDKKINSNINPNIYNGSRDIDKK
jgi:Ca2+/Na+ antiporter